MIRKFKKLNVFQIIVIGFMSMILIGAIILSLPISGHNYQSTNFIDALYIATSAVCVTGQSVFENLNQFNYFGKTVIMLLIELGGLGFMSIIVMIYTLMKKSLNYKQRLVIQESLNVESTYDANVMIKYLIKFSLTAQLIGAILLSIRFIPQLGTLKGIYFSVFHAISAFCNAGFDLFTNSMVNFRSDPYILTIIMALIVTGGLGFVVWRNILNYRKIKRFYLQTKITLIGTTFLIVTSVIFFYISEGNHGTFSDLSGVDRFFNTLFLSITPRTAGFYTVDYTTLSMGGKYLTLLLMFIGGSSGSIAGGVKITTVFVILYYVYKSMRDEELVIDHKSIGPAQVKKSTLVFVSSVALVILATLILSLTEHVPEGFGLEYILFDVFSCFGTVGLTLGLSLNLTMIGKFVSIFLMFVGRIGLVTFIMSIGHKKHHRNAKERYPDAHITIG